MQEKNELLSTNNFLSRKFAAVCRKIATLPLPYFLNQRHRN